MANKGAAVKSDLEWHTREAKEELRIGKRKSFASMTLHSGANNVNSVNEHSAKGKQSFSENYERKSSA
jgi:hypothetical protein